MTRGDRPGSRIDVAAAIVFRGPLVLIARRPEGKPLPGLWEFPGGKLDPGETWEECLRRECLEELGVPVEIREPYGEVVHEYPERTVRLRFFRCEVPSGEPEPLGAAEIRWVPAVELPGFQFPPADAEMVRRLASGDRGSAE